MSGFGDYVIYVDESGDPNLESIDKDFPAFGLSFCVFNIGNYLNSVCPKMQKLKFDFWGHDCAVLHEHEIRKQLDDFAFLRGLPATREHFFDELNKLIEEIDFTIFASVIDKHRLRNKYKTPYNPYNIALRFCMERSLKSMLGLGQGGKTIYVIFESRGKKEDSDLELVFRRMCDNEGSLRQYEDDFSKVDFRIRFASKKSNSAGLQLADLTARPLVLSYIRPEQENRALSIIRNKIPNGGIKLFP